MSAPLDIVILGLSITSSWGNGHATTYRGLVRELAKRGHRVLFLERDMPWYSKNRDLPDPPLCQTKLYSGLEELNDAYASAVRQADLVIVGSYVPEGIDVGEWVNRTADGVTAFYDIDTPVTLARLRRGECDYLVAEQVPQYALYLSFAGGRALEQVEGEFGSPMARPLYCAVDPAIYYPEEREKKYDLAYMGTYSDDRQPPLDRLLIQAARDWPEGRFLVAGPQYPATIAWPENVARVDHLPPSAHREFYNQQRFTQNITRADMIAVGWSPSVRLFEAAACGTPIISDWWEGLDDFFVPGAEILVSRSPAETLHYLQEMTEAQRVAIGRRAREKVLARHTAAHRAVEVEDYFEEAGRRNLPSAAAKGRG